MLQGIAAWQHPVIVLKDVPYSHLQGIVEFIYHGEVSVDQVLEDSFNHRPLQLGQAKPAFAHATPTQS